MSAESEIERLRARIDQIDQDILKLINDRITCAKKIGSSKAKEGSPVVYRPERESQIIQSLRDKNEGPINTSQLAHIFREIISISRAAEAKLRVAVLGPAGTYSQAAGFKHFGHSVETLCSPTIDQVFHDVENNSADYGVVPVENSTEGGVSNTLHCLVGTPLTICGEINLRINHCLVSQNDSTAIPQHNRLMAHEQSFAQCRQWLDTHFPGVPRINVASNAEAARLAATDAEVAAIASEETAEIYGLKVLGRNIEDQPGNTTRFLVIGKHPPGPSGYDKTSVLLSSRNRPGALYDLLTPLAKHGISMTRIESRPSRTGLWEYVFFVDFEGHVDDPSVAEAMTELSSEAALFKLLGAYPRATV